VVDWVTELDGASVEDDDVLDGAAGNAVAVAPWPDNAFVGKVCRSNRQEMRESASYGRKVHGGYQHLAQRTRS
jgi:hypothetical protein